MSKTVIGLYRTESEVQNVMNDLASHDFPRSGITRYDSADDDLRRWLTAQGVPDREAVTYVDGVRDGGHLVTLEASDDRSRDAVAIMRRHEQSMGGDTAATMRPDADADRHERMRGEHDETLEVVEEELDVGKREVERGGVHVRTYVTETPVEERVRLRDETIEVERHDVDRPLSDAEAGDAFRERSIEMSETDEEAVVGKRARVIEEVVLSKDVDERTETVRDTVRRTDVEVEGAEDMHGGYRFDDDREHFRTHHRTNFANSDYDYENFEPAYRYGTALHGHPDYRDANWNDISTSARDRWERRNAGTWNEFEPAVRYGYERARTRGRS